MAIKGSQALTYRDLLSGLKGDKEFDHDLVDLMVQNSPMLDDMVITEANDGTSNKTTIRTGLPTATWSAFYEGVQSSKGSKQQIRNTAGYLRSKLEIDAELYEIAPDKNALLQDEISAHTETMMQEMAEALVYGNIKDNPRKFNGLTSYYNGFNSTDENNSNFYCLNAAKASNPSTSALRSIFLVGWSQKSIRCFYPQGSKGGMKKGEFKKIDVVDTVKGGTYEAYAQYFTWMLGLDVRDFRYGGRLANIESDAILLASGQPDYIELLRRLTTRVRAEGVKRVLYMDRLMWENITILLARKTMSNAVSSTQLQERITETLFGIPVRLNDAMNVNESLVANV